jgi:hypothetical protein
MACLNIKWMIAYLHYFLIDESYCDLFFCNFFGKISLDFKKLGPS